MAHAMELVLHYRKHAMKILLNFLRDAWRRLLADEAGEGLSLRRKSALLRQRLNG